MKESLREFDILHTHFLFNKRSRYTIPGLIIQAFTSFHNAYELAKKGREVIRILPKSFTLRYYPQFPNAHRADNETYFAARRSELTTLKLAKAKAVRGYLSPPSGEGGAPMKYFSARRAPD